MPNPEPPRRQDAPLVEISNRAGVHDDHLEALRNLARTVLVHHGARRGALSVVLTDDAEIRKIHRDHLGHDTPTDIVTFDLADDPDPRSDAVDAELVLSVDTARDAARRLGSDTLSELALYVVHGILHLRGHDDRHPDDAARMRDAERQALRDAGWPEPVPAPRETES